MVYWNVGTVVSQFNACIHMALEACNASVAHDVEGAKQKLDALTLDNYLGKNVTNMATEAQRLLKIMQCL
jgi:ABC-type branched-subunit amino acid transport system ATPase component